MEECESLDSEMTELQEFQCEASEAIGPDDDDEVEELRNSLREAVQDQSVKPKLQCLMVDPSFSMVTVQSEDSGIIWETASSRCSTPWASETSSISEAYSMEGSGSQGKITIVFDEEKIVRRRIRSGGRSSRLGDRLSRPGSSRSASALGVERPEMAEVSIPNVKLEKTETTPDLEEIKDKDQQLFSLISEGYEILNIRVPSKLPTVDEEESTELQDNLCYLNQTPRIRSRNHHGLAQPHNHALPGEVEILEHKEASEQDSSQPLADTEVGHTHTQKDNTTDMDYFEKFTLVDKVVPAEQAPELQEEVEQPPAKIQAEEQKPGKETATDSPSTSEDSFVFVTDVDIAGEHLDEVFYGNGVHGAPLQRKEDEEVEMGTGKRIRRGSQRSLKESGSVLFGSEEITLTPIFLSPGPPKIIDLILLEEPTAMSFMYSDLYEDAMGETRKSDEEYSEAESVASERYFKRRLSDSEEADGYLEKFTLKDSTPTVEAQPDSKEDKNEGRMLWSQSAFEMTGCLRRVVEEEEEEVAKEEPKTQEVSAAEMSGHVQSPKYEEKEEWALDTGNKGEEIKPCTVIKEQALPTRRGSEESMHMSKLQEEQKEDQEVKQEVKKDHSEPSGGSIDEPVTLSETEQVDIKVEKKAERKEHKREEPAEKTNEPGIIAPQTLTVIKKAAEGTEETPAKVKAPVTSEVPQKVLKPETQTDIQTETQVPAKIGDIVEDTVDVGREDTESLSEEATLDTKIVADEQKVEKVNGTIVAKAKSPTEVKEPETMSQEVVTCTGPLLEIEISTEAAVDGKMKAVVSEKHAPVEVSTGSKPTIQAVVEVTEKAVDETKIQTQVQIALQEVTSAETPGVQMVVPEEEKIQDVVREETVVASQLSENMTEAVVADHESEAKIVSKAIEPIVQEEVKPDASKNVLEVFEHNQSQQQESGKESDETELKAAVKAKTSTEDNEAVQETVDVADELILLVPKGQAVEMDIEITPSDTVAPPEPESICDNLTAPDNTVSCSAPPQSPTEDMLPELGPPVKPEVVPKEGALSTKDLDRWPSPPAPVGLEEEQKMEDFEEDEGVFSPLRSFIPLQDLSGLHVKSETDMNKEDVEPTTKMQRVAHVPETDMNKEDVEPTTKMQRVAHVPETDMNKEDVEPTTKMQRVAHVPETDMNKEDVEPTTKMQRVAHVPETDMSKEDVEPTTKMQRVAHVPETDMNKEDVEPTTKMQRVAHVPETDMSKEDVEPTTKMQRVAHVPETDMSKEDVEPTTKMQRVAHVPETDMNKEDVEPTTKMQRVAHVSETDMSKEDVEPTTKMQRVAHVPETDMSKEDVEPTTKMQRVAHVPETDMSKEDVEPTTKMQRVAHVSETDMSKEDVEPTTKMQRVAHVPETDMNKEDVEPTTKMQRVAHVSETDMSKEDVEPTTKMQRVAHVPETDMNKEDVEPTTKMQRVAHVPETDMNKEDVALEIEQHREDVGQKMELQGEVAEGPDGTAEELEYEIISTQEARKMAEPEMERVAEEPRPESVQERGETEKMEIEMGMEMEERVLDLPPGEELIEDDYDIIGAEEESQARAAAELQGMEWFCVPCGCLLPGEHCVSGEHQDHEVTSVDRAYEDIKERLSEWISELQGRSENIEDLVSELELAYNSIEDQCTDSEEAMQAQNEEMMALVMEQYNNMSLSMEEEKKVKLEQLYDQIVSFQESIDSAKGALETTAREAETDARSLDDIDARLKTTLESATSLELGPRGLLVFEDYAKGNASNSHLAQRKGIPVPQKPTLQPQEQGSATSTSVTVYWRVNPGDIIDCFQVYCMEDPHGAVSEEYRVTVKESYCVLEELEPDKTYKVWVMAVNYTGCSLPSERLAFRTAPSVPVIDTERCTVLWDSATLRWSSAKQTPGQSYTLEYCRQYELEGEGLRSISGVNVSEQNVLLQPNENYLFYIKAVNEAGASEQSEAALISTKGTRFHLLNASAHPFLELSEDQTTLHFPQDIYDSIPPEDKQYPSILGELLPARGHYYWETTVRGSTAYRLGVAYREVNRDSPLGENSESWCLHCIPTPSSCRYQLLHNDVQSEVLMIEMPERVGTLLDYQHGRLSFFNATSGQLLGTLSHRFTQPCHPALSLEMPGSLEVSMALEVPEFTKHS